jgi:hypothetical protein
MCQNGFSKLIELSVNVAELLMNSTELSANAAEFQFFGRLLFISHVKHDLTLFIDFSDFFKNHPDRPCPIFFYPYEFSNSGEDM